LSADTTSQSTVARNLRRCNRNTQYRYIKDHVMASNNIRIDDDLKACAYHELEKLGITASELLRQTLQYVAEHGQLPISLALMTEEDRARMVTVHERLAAPQRVKVVLDDL
jgi:RHH-type rel operon transcriptional repressor/antitoxin RelB